MTFEVRFSAAADEDIERLVGFLIDRAQTIDGLATAQTAIDALCAIVLRQLALSPYSCRKIGSSPTRREMIVPFGATGYVALFEIASPTRVVVLALRHQREEDYH